ncbi:hypothetical protein JHK87_029022 [Glycine soja]|nr:hypothetical protein JHK87_029022 [Glycine soja]
MFETPCASKTCCAPWEAQSFSLPSPLLHFQPTLIFGRSKREGNKKGETRLISAV